MDLGRPISTAISTLDGPVLGVLVRAGAPLTGRKVHQLAGTGSESGTRKVLNRLAGTGLVIATEVGSSIQYSLNRDHLAAGPVIELADLRQGLVRRLQDVIETDWSVRPLHASLFGAAARGDGGLESVVDLLLIHEDASSEWTRQLASLTEQVRKWTGNPLRIHALSVGDLHEHLAIGDPIMSTWLREGLLVSGPELRALLKTVAS
jgi:predicted nucleotidyltransferase